MAGAQVLFPQQYFPFFPSLGLRQMWTSEAKGKITAVRKGMCEGQPGDLLYFHYHSLAPPALPQIIIKLEQANGQAEW